MSGHCPECGNTLCICDQISTTDRIRAKLAEVKRLADEIKREPSTYKLLEKAQDLRRASQMLARLVSQYRKEVAAAKRAGVPLILGWSGPTC